MLLNELNLLMDLDPLEHSSIHIDEIIAFMRRWRENHEAGEKELPKIDLVQLGLVKPKKPLRRR